MTSKLLSSERAQVACSSTGGRSMRGSSLSVLEEPGAILFTQAGMGLGWKHERPWGGPRRVGSQELPWEKPRDVS